MPVRKEVQREVKTSYRTGERRSMPGGKGEEERKPLIIALAGEKKRRRADGGRKGEGGMQNG